MHSLAVCNSSQGAVYAWDLNYSDLIQSSIFLPFNCQKIRNKKCPTDQKHLSSTVP